MSVQKFQDLSNILPVLFPADSSLAGGLALSDMIIEAGAVLPRISWQHLIAGTNLVQLMDQVNRILHCPCAGVWPKVFVLVLFHRSRKQYPGKFLSHRHLDVGIGLIILQHGIVTWSVLLDKVALQNQGLQF